MLLFRRFSILFVILAILSGSSSFAQTGGDNPRFAEVGKSLDQGGSMYVYLDVKDKVRQIFNTAKEFILVTDESEETKQVLGIAEQVIDSLGLFAIEDFGFSAAKTGEYYRSKCVVRIPGERKGFFKILGGAPHTLDMIGQAPENTVLLRGFDLDLAALYDFVREIAVKVGGPEALVGIDEALQAGGDLVGANVSEVIRSLSGKWTLFLVLDDTTKFTVPGLEPPVTIPQPKLGIVIGTKDDTLYKALCGILATPEKIEKLPDGTEVKIRDIPPPSSEDMPLSPKFAFDGKQVILVSHADLLDFPLGRAASKPTLAENTDYKKLSANLPKEGNDVAFISPRLWTTLETVLNGLPPELIGEGPMNPKAISTLVEQTPLATGLVAIRVNDQGGLYVAASSPSDLGLSSLIGSSAQVGGALGSIFSSPPRKVPKKETEKATEESDDNDADEEADEVEDATGEETDTPEPAENESATDEAP